MIMGIFAETIGMRRNALNILYRKEMFAENDGRVEFYQLGIWRYDAEIL